MYAPCSSEHSFLTSISMKYWQRVQNPSQDCHIPPIQVWYSNSFFCDIAIYAQTLQALTSNFSSEIMIIPTSSSHFSFSGVSKPHFVHRNTVWHRNWHKPDPEPSWAAYVLECRFPASTVLGYQKWHEPPFHCSWRNITQSHFWIYSIDKMFVTRIIT